MLSEVAGPVLDCFEIRGDGEELSAPTESIENVSRAGDVASFVVCEKIVDGAEVVVADIVTVEWIHDIMVFAKTEEVEIVSQRMLHRGVDRAIEDGGGK